MAQVVHTIYFPVSARSFVQPMTAHLIEHGIPAELWIENMPAYSHFTEGIYVPKRLVATDITFNPNSFRRKLSDLRAQLQTVNPRVLHAHQTRSSLLPLLAASLEGVPVRIYHNHGLPYLGHHGILRMLLKTLESINIRLATHVLCVSRSTLDAARADGLLLGKGAVLANGSAVGIDLAEFASSYFNEGSSTKAKEQFGVGGSTFVLGYVGRPVKRKGFHLLLKAWEKSDLAARGCWLLIAGCTTTECEAALGHQARGVKALGYIGDLRPFYAASDAVALPSEHEGFPYSLLEGAAAGKPLIGTDIPGVRCAIKNNQTGLLIPPNDDIALTQAMTALASNPQLRSELGTKARARVEQDFTRELVLSSLLDFYRTQLGF